MTSWPITLVRRPLAAILGLLLLASACGTSDSTSGTAESVSTAADATAPTAVATTAPLEAPASVPPADGAGAPVDTPDTPETPEPADEMAEDTQVDDTAMAEPEPVAQEDPPAAAEMGKRGHRAVIERWNWQATSERLVAMYREIRREREIASG